MYYENDPACHLVHSICDVLHWISKSRCVVLTAGTGGGARNGPGFQEMDRGRKPCTAVNNNNNKISWRPTTETET